MLWWLQTIIPHQPPRITINARLSHDSESGLNDFQTNKAANEMMNNRNRMFEKAIGLNLRGPTS